MSRDYPRGSEWRKWDLHIHTPASILHSYPGEDPWKGFLEGLESLPPEIKVIGINDYLFLDGYRRVVEEKERGRLANIETIFPVIELRLDKFGGSPGHLSRVNYHVVFSDELSPDDIEQQFLNALTSKYVLSPKYDHLRTSSTWAALPTRRSLKDLGQLIIQSAPAKERAKFGSPIVEGFNNLSLSLESIQKALEVHYFRGRFLTAVGKTEWADIKWNDHSIADKKNIINGADLVFISAVTPDACKRAKDALAAAMVNSRLLDCSDAHSLSSASTKDRLGKCFTWIKADPTFQGLRQLLYEPEGRIYLGDEPPPLARVRENRTKYMTEVRFWRPPGAETADKWFGGSIPLNHGLVAVIGNKGSGKSALADIVALLGDTTASAHFSFLNQDRFLAPKTAFGRSFGAEVAWHSGRSVRRLLGESVDSAAPELVKYIPQNYLERICTELIESRSTGFERELMEVIFSHVRDEDRLGMETLPDLIEYLTNEGQQGISLLRSTLAGVNADIIGLEEQLTPEFRKGLEAQLAQRRSEQEAHEGSKPVAVPRPDQDLSAQEAAKSVAIALAALQNSVTELDAKVSVAREQLGQATRQVAAADRLSSRIDNLERSMTLFYADSIDDREALNVDLDKLVELRVNREPIINARQQAQERIAAVETDLNPGIEGSLVAQRSTVLAQIEANRLELDEPSRKYQNYLQQLADWETRRAEIEGGADIPQSVRGLEARLQTLDVLPPRRAAILEERMKVVRDIYDAKTKLLADYRRLYSPVQRFIDEHPVSKKQQALQFFASVTIDGFEGGLLEMIHQGRKGSFQGDEGSARLRQLVLGADFSSKVGVEAFLAMIQGHLEKDKGANDEAVRADDQLRQGFSTNDLYDFLYGLQYLRPRFELRWHQKPLDQLSPGERGTLLLVFFLLIDRRDVPLVIDQPEENLDNHTVATTLVPAVKYAKDRRQIVIVTHNPNLAVVCDSDQVIHATLDKAEGNRVTYKSGAIENREITQRIVDVLEGTKPAFDNRGARYAVLERLT